MNRFKALVLGVCFLFIFTSSASAAVLGPALTYEELRQLVSGAQDGDVILVSGALSGEGYDPLTCSASLTITSDSDSPATLSGVRLQDASIQFSSINLADSLSVSGTSHIELRSGVQITGAPGQSGLSFDGNGSLLMYPGAAVIGGEGGEGMIIRHRGGDFYGGIEGTVRGGDGTTGGAGLTISPLTDTGTLMISGAIEGGTGSAMGGQALNLYDLSGNAYVTVSGKLQGGSGAVGGDGVQLVAASGSVSVGIEAQISGGQGEAFGGDALILMNISGASSINLEGSLTGGDVTETGAQPGMSLLVVGETTASRTRVGDCHLQDGRDLAALNATPTPSPEPTPVSDVTPLPEITSSMDEAVALPSLEPTPSPTPAPTPTAEPTEEPTAQPTVQPTAEPTVEPTSEPTAEPTAEPTVEPTVEPTSEPAAEPTAEPTPEPTTDPTADPSLPPLTEEATPPLEAKADTGT